jgi:hypothetical protein
MQKKFLIILLEKSSLKTHENCARRHNEFFHKSSQMIFLYLRVVVPNALFEKKKIVWRKEILKKCKYLCIYKSLTKNQYLLLW